MSRFLSLLSLIVVGVALVACQPAVTSSDTPTALEEKTGTTTKTGVVSGSAGQYVLQSSGPPEPIDSYSVELHQYVGQNVTVTGQYSGNTLFVGSITAN